MHPHRVPAAQAEAQQGEAVAGGDPALRAPKVLLTGLALGLAVRPTLALNAEALAKAPQAPLATGAWDPQ